MRNKVRTYRKVYGDEPNEPPDLVLYRVRVLFPIQYSIRVAQQDSAFKMTHIEAKSINIWLRYTEFGFLM